MLTWAANTYKSFLGTDSNKLAAHGTASTKRAGYLSAPTKLLTNGAYGYVPQRTHDYAYAPGHATWKMRWCIGLRPKGLDLFAIYTYTQTCMYACMQSNHTTHTEHTVHTSIHTSTRNHTHTHESTHITHTSINTQIHKCITT